MYSNHDRDILRSLAEEVATIAASPEMAARRERWTRHNDLDSPAPLLLVFPEGAWAELLPHTALSCEDDQARHWEWDLRSRLYTHEHFHADHVVEAEWVVHRAIRSTGWGLAPRQRPAPSSRGAWAFDPVVSTPADLDRLTTPQLSVDDAATAAAVELAESTFGDLLTVRTVGLAHVSYHLYYQWTALRGLEQTYEDMVADPEFLHAALRRLTDAHHDLRRQAEALGLYSPNNNNTYQATGGNGYTATLDPPATGPVPTQQMWASAESQELDPVSPAMHREFALQYEAELLAPWGLTGYGCCERLHNKLADVCALPGMRRISMSPFCDLPTAAAQVADRFIFSFKPQPSHLVGAFDERVVREYLREALAVCRGTVLEIILKDTHTCDGRPERFDRWTRICREEIDAASPGWRGA